MLVLSRIKGKSIMIGDDVEIKVVDVRGDTVRLGIIAPKDLPVHRREIWEAIKREQTKNEDDFDDDDLDDDDDFDDEDEDDDEST